MAAHRVPCPTHHAVGAFFPPLVVHRLLIVVVVPAAAVLDVTSVPAVIWRRLGRALCTVTAASTASAVSAASATSATTDSCQ